MQVRISMNKYHSLVCHQEADPKKDHNKEQIYYGVFLKSILSKGEKRNKAGLG